MVASGFTQAIAYPPTYLPTYLMQQQQRADGFQMRLLRQLFLDTLLPTKSQWVVMAVRQQAGAAIATLRPAPAVELLPLLLQSYCGAAVAVGPGAVDVRRSCGESFADVVAKVGRRWGQRLFPPGGAGCCLPGRTATNARDPV